MTLILAIVDLWRLKRKCQLTALHNSMSELPQALLGYGEEKCKMPKPSCRFKNVAVGFIFLDLGEIEAYLGDGANMRAKKSVQSKV